MKYTKKMRMLNAYKGIFSDRYPVAPEFWYYYPAKVLGVSMIEFEREIPFWKSLNYVFEKYDCEGWGISFPHIQNENKEVLTKMDGYEEITSINYNGKKFESKKMFSKDEPSWVTKYLAEDLSDLSYVIDMMIDEKNTVDFKLASEEHTNVGESYLLEWWLGVPFFDFIAELTGFEQAVIYFMEEDEDVLKKYRDRYTQYQKNLIRQVSQNTPFESFNIGCSYSCNSLIGPNMWRKWDKPYLKEIADEVHKCNKLLHIHFHGRSIETAEDFKEIGIDCVCPFERPPGGDIVGLEGLKYVREKLGGKVTMNGNVHTVETLIRGNVQDVKREVREIKEAFDGEPRLIIGTGDQVGVETPEENILAMIDEAKLCNE